LNDEASDVDCLACWEGHVGKSVWSLAIDPSRKIVVSCILGERGKKFLVNNLFTVLPFQGYRWRRFRNSIMVTFIGYK
jgi:hypothetical protein